MDKERLAAFEKGQRLGHEAPPQKLHVLSRRDDSTGADVGGGAGYGNIKGYLDTHGTIMANGCYEECLPELIQKGFLPDAHGAAYDYHYPNKAVMGFFTNAVEDKTGLYVEWAFHSDEHAQDLRNKLAEREANGKACGMSIGFMIGDSIGDPVGWTFSPDQQQPEGIDYIVLTPQHYATQIPRWSAPQYVQQNLARAEGMYCVCILLRVYVFEVSPTLIPSNEASQIQQIRSEKKPRKSRTKVTKQGDLLTVSKSLDKISSNFREATEDLSQLSENDFIALAQDLGARALSQITTLTTMAQINRRDDDARDDAVRDAYETHDKLKRALKRAGEHHDDMRDALDEANKHAKTLGKHLDKMDDKRDDDDDDEEKDKRSISKIARKYTN